MTPETNEHLDKAREYLVKARNLLDVMDTMTKLGAPPISLRFTPRKL